MHRAVVLGSRFGGLAVQTWLRRLYPPSDLHITVIDQWHDVVFRPGLVHAADQPPAHLVEALTVQLEPFWRRRDVEFVHDIVVAVDPERRQVHTATHHPSSYDVLFIATGATPLWDAVPGMDVRRRGICEGYLARHAAAQFTRGEPGRYVFAMAPLEAPSHWNPRPRVGCECPLFETALLWDARLRKLKKRSEATLTIVTPASVIAEQAGKKGQDQLGQMLADRDVSVITNAQYHSVSDQSLVIGGRTLPFEHIVWIPGMGGSRWLIDSGVADDEGWVPVTDYLQHPQWPTIYAVGDIVSRPWPKMGHSAMVQARVAVQHYWRTQHSKSLKALPPFRPQLVWVLEDRPGQALFVLSDTYWNGRTERVWHSRIPYWAKQLFQKSYVKRSGALPIMP